jgi:hypothetical protein
VFCRIISIKHLWFILFVHWSEFLKEVTILNFKATFKLKFVFSFESVSIQPVMSLFTTHHYIYFRTFQQQARPCYTD